MIRFEDVRTGATRELGSHIFTAVDIKRFALAYDPQPFHTDEVAAEKSHFGGLCASGWHTLAVMMRLTVRAADGQGGEPEAGTAGDRAPDSRAPGGQASPQLGPSPGFDELKWLRPVYAGDTISFATEVIEKRESRSRPGWGLIRFRNTGVNQHGAEVLTIIGNVFVEMRGGEAGG